MHRVIDMERCLASTAEKFRFELKRFTEVSSKFLVSFVGETICQRHERRHSKSVERRRKIVGNEWRVEAKAYAKLN